MSRRLGYFATEAVHEARRVQSRLVSGEITASHIIEQTHWGWAVHRIQLEDPEGKRVLNGKTTELDQFVCSDRGINKMRQIQRHERLVASAKGAHVRALTLARDRARAAMVGFDDEAE